MSKLKDRLIKLGYEAPELRPHLRSILSHVLDAAQSNKTAELDRNFLSKLENQRKELLKIVQSRTDVGVRQTRSGESHLSHDETYASDIVHHVYQFYTFLEYGGEQARLIISFETSENSLPVKARVELESKSLRKKFRVSKIGRDSFEQMARSATQEALEKVQNFVDHVNGVQ